MKPKPFSLTTFLIIIHDPEHSDEEDRWVIIGASHDRRLLVVAYTERGHAIRLISARKATRAERRKYEQKDF